MRRKYCQLYFSVNRRPQTLEREVFPKDYNILFDKLNQRFWWCGACHTQFEVFCFYSAQGSRSYLPGTRSSRVASDFPPSPSPPPSTHRVTHLSLTPMYTMAMSTATFSTQHTPIYTMTALPPFPLNTHTHTHTRQFHDSTLKNQILSSS